MKRDMKLIYLILKRIEEADYDSSKGGGLINKTFDGYDEAAVDYHLTILDESDLVHPSSGAKNAPKWRRLTWQGNDLLEELERKFSGRSGVF